MLEHLKGIDKPFTVRVTPKASRNAIKVDGDVIRIYITTVPEDGKANKAVIALLAKELGVAKSKLTIIHGETSKNKTISITK
ncbi:MAG: hypothetical protein ACI9TY_000285 [Alphaproteobacteria bacterium]|jgi:uncharacterized protein (TIGR00251 family)